MRENLTRDIFCLFLPILPRLELDDTAKRFLESGGISLLFGETREEYVSRIIDAERIAIFGDGLGAAFASRAAATDHRISAAVCDAGIWDLHERAFLLGRISGSSDPDSIEDQLSKLWRHSIATRIQCPILVTLGECDWLTTNYAVGFYRYLKQAGIDISVKTFLATETAASNAQIDNPTLGNEFIFDWIAARLGPTAQPNAPRENDVSSPPQTLTRLSQDDF